MIPTILATFAIGAATVGQVAPRIYRSHTTNELARVLDDEYGPDGWVAVWVVSDNQSGEQINLYRTIYLKLLYPKYRNAIEILPALAQGEIVDALARMERVDGLNIRVR